MVMGSLEGWADYENQRLTSFDNQYWTSKIADVKGNLGSINREDKSFSAPKHSLLPVEQMWNQYLKAAQSRGIRPDYTLFKTNYENLKELDNQQFLGLINTASLAGLSQSKIKKSIDNNPEMKARLEQLFMQSSDNPELQASIAPYLTESGGGNILDTLTENPLLAGGLGYGGYQAYKRFGGGKGFGLGVSSMLPFSGDILAGLMENFGVEEGSAEDLGDIGQIGLGLGLGGASAAKEIGRLFTPGGRAKLREEYYRYGRGTPGKGGYAFKPLNSLNDFKGLKIPDDIREKINKHRKGKHSLGNTAKWSEKSIGDYREINPKANINELAKKTTDAKGKPILSQKFNKTKLFGGKGKPGRAGALLALASALMGGYNLLTEE